LLQDGQKASTTQGSLFPQCWQCVLTLNAPPPPKESMQTD